MRNSFLAFPSIGCGHLGHDPKIISEHMIGETYRQLKNSFQSQLIVSFVLLPEQKNVYDAFADRLNMIQHNDDTPTSIPFDKQST
jgi:O-acetyl-ADP-ribose deacetylase (regulator of RNase III)